MDFHFDLSLAENYHSNSQKIRVMSENWVGKNVFCQYVEIHIFVICPIICLSPIYNVITAEKFLN